MNKAMSNKTFFWYQRQVMSSGTDTEFINIIKCHGYGERGNLSQQDEATKIRSALKIRQHSQGCFNGGGWGLGPVTRAPCLVLRPSVRLFSGLGSGPVLSFSVGSQPLGLFHAGVFLWAHRPWQIICSKATVCVCV